MPQVVVQSTEGQTSYATIATDVDVCATAGKDWLQFTRGIESIDSSISGRAEQQIRIAAAVHIVRTGDQTGERDPHKVGRGGNVASDVAFKMLCRIIDRVQTTGIRNREHRLAGEGNTGDSATWRHAQDFKCLAE